jgi:cyclohexa-1,5-dienecarbonyl-CoA hydratase
MRFGRRSREGHVRPPVSVSFDARQSRAAFTLFHETGNIITAGMVESLRAALETVAENPHLKLITIEGSGSDFSFGASVQEHAPDRIRQVLGPMHELIYELLDAPAVTAAIVRGRCLGGGFELALACDFIFAAETAVFGLPEIGLGVFPPAGSVLLPQRVGAARATSAVLTGAVSTAPEWLAAGLLELVAPLDRLDGDVDRWFQAHLAGKSAAALRHAASAARMGLVAHVREMLPKVERLYLEDLMRTQDAVEGIDAFLAKRQPAWTDR